MKRLMKRLASCLFIVLSAVLFMGTAYGVIDSYEFSTAEQEQRFFELTNELRCPKCQNQSIADSNAPIARDLRREVHRLLNEGADNQAVVNFMLARYGDFVLYKPRLSGVNLVLWLGPLLLMLAGTVVLVTVVRRHRNFSQDMSSESSAENLTPEQEARLNNKLNSFSCNGKQDHKKDGKE